MLLCALAASARADACGDKFGASSFEANRCRGALLDHLFWVDRSYRHEASFACNQQLTRERMHDLWSSYLSTPGGGQAEFSEP